MITMNLSEAARPLNARLTGNDVSFTGCSTDSRTLRRGELFVALRGPRFDGHDWVGQAASRGAPPDVLSSGGSKSCEPRRKQATKKWRRRWFSWPQDKTND